MSRKKKPARPEPITMGEVRARAVRPRGARGPDDGRWYWRAQLARRDVWVGWGAREEVCQAIAVEMATGKLGDAAADRARVVEIKTIRDLMEYWISTVLDREDLAERTRIAYQGASKRIVRDLGPVSVERIVYRDVEEWRNIALRKRKPRTVALDQTVLRRALSWGRRIGACPDREIPEVEIRIPKEERRIPTPGEVAAVVRQLERDAPPWAALFIRVQYAIGARVGEVADITPGALRQRVDEKGAASWWLTVRGKTGPRTVPIRPDVATALQAHSEAQPDRRPWGVTGGAARFIWRYLRDACDAAEVERFTCHGLRYAAVNQMARTGVDVSAAAAMLGHTPQVMLQTYRQVSDADRLKALALADLGHLPAGEVIEMAASGHRSGHNSEDEQG